MRAASSQSSAAGEPNLPSCRDVGVLLELDSPAGEDEHAANVMRKVKIEDTNSAADRASINNRSNGTSSSAPAATTNGRPPSPASSPDDFQTQSSGSDNPQPTKTPGIARRTSHKPAMREPPLFRELSDATSESCQGFQVITDCLYGSKHLGSTDHDALDCDCRDDWREGVNFACGEDSDCINRATKMECSPVAGGNCAGGCQNQRFQRKEWAAVSVIKTEMKGYGLRTDADLLPNDFIYEYIGEVISEPTFRRRMLQYDAQGIKHFYFMSLNKNEFVDATMKGNLGRFCNHSCSPNCYVDKWVVGDKLRMGIFALRDIRAGEELVFNYNVDRYGADPQPCYCGEPNCVGFIGGKTQTERATKLPAATVEALGIDDADGWDVAVAKKPRRKRPDEDDEDYVNAVQPRHLDEEGARKVMAALMQCREKWIAVKLLQRIQRSEDDRVLHCVMRMHAYQILRTTLNTFIEDRNVVRQVLDILDKFPRLTRNKIQDSNIEAVITVLATSEHDDVASMSKKLLDDWSKLELAYRIRRRKLDPNAAASQKENVYEERRGGGQARPEPGAQMTASRAAAAAASPPRPVDAPKGPRGSVAQRNSPLFLSNGQRPPRRPFYPPLPDGWFSAKDGRGNTYFYTKTGTTTWQRPTEATADTAPKGPSKAVQEQLAIQSIIDRVTKEGTPKQTPIQQQQQQQQQHQQQLPSSDASANTSKHAKDKWRALPIDKQMKIYENTVSTIDVLNDQVFPPVKHVLNKFRHTLPKEELKRLGKDIAKKLVASDFKNKRVDDPTAKLSEKQTSKVKKYVNDFLKRAVEKYDAHHRHRAPSDKPAVEAQQQAQSQSQAPAGDDGSIGGAEGQEGLQPDTDGLGDGESPAPTPQEGIGVADEAEDDSADASDADSANTPCSPDRKRKREKDTVSRLGGEAPSEPDVKKPKTGQMLDESSSPPPPPPPPPPPGPGGEEEVDVIAVNEEMALLREQEEALMRENEEAERLEGEETGGEGGEEEDEEEDEEEEAIMGRPTVAAGNHHEHIPIVA